MLCFEPAFPIKRLHSSKDLAGGPFGARGTPTHLLKVGARFAYQPTAAMASLLDLFEEWQSRYGLLHQCVDRQVPGENSPSRQQIHMAAIEKLSGSVEHNHN